MTFLAMPQHKNHCSRGHEIYNFGGPSLNKCPIRSLSSI